MYKKIIFLVVILLFVVTSARADYSYEVLPDGTYDVTFTYYNPDAERVCLASAFNNYSPTATPMEKREDGTWVYTINMTQGVYEYKYVVDGKWTADPDIEERTEAMGNSVIRLKSNKMKGDFEITGELTGKLRQEGTDAAVEFSEYLMTDITGDVIAENSNRELINYRAKIIAEGLVDDIENIESEAEILSIDKIYLDNMELKYSTKLANYILQANKEDKRNSFDYLGIIDADTVSDDRDFTKAPNDFGDNRRFLILSDGDNYQFNAAFTEYTKDIGEQESNEKYLCYLNYKRDLKDETGKIRGEVGTSSLIYQPVVVGDIKELSSIISLFGKYELSKNLTIRGEYGRVPVGNINESLSGTFREDANNWKFIFDPQDYDFDEDDIEDIDVVRIAGAFNGWNSADPEYVMEKVEDEDIWTAIFEFPMGTQFSWIVDGEWIPGGIGNLLEVKARAEDEPLDYEDMYMAEANYKVLDPHETLKQRQKVYKYNYTLGGELVPEDAYLKVASDRLLDDKKDDGIFRGIKRYYFDGYYNIDVSGLKLDLAVEYQPDLKDNDIIISRKVKPGFYWEEPYKNVEYVKGHINYNKSKNFSWDKISNDQNNPDLISELFLKTKVEPDKLFKYVDMSSTYRYDLRSTMINLETAFKTEKEEINYIKSGLDYVSGSYGEDKAEKPRFWFETMLDSPRQIATYFPEIILGYQYDESNLNEKMEYFDPDDDDQDEDDWTQKIYGGLTVSIPDLEKFSGNIKLESMKIEEDKFFFPADIETDSVYFDADSQKFIEWYTLLTFNADYLFSSGTSTNLDLIYDLSHNEISNFEDYSLKLEVARPITDFTTLKLLYNKKEGDVKNISEISIETLF